MGNYYKRVVYVGVQVPTKEFQQATGVKGSSCGDGVCEWAEDNKIELSGHDQNTGAFGRIYTDDGFICIGQIVDASGEDEPEPRHVDLLGAYEKYRFIVSDKLRLLKVTVGEVKLYVTTLCY